MWRVPGIDSINQNILKDINSYILPNQDCFYACVSEGTSLKIRETIDFDSYSDIM